MATASTFYFRKGKTVPIFTLCDLIDPSRVGSQLSCRCLAASASPANKSKVRSEESKRAASRIVQLKYGTRPYRNKISHNTADGDGELKYKAPKDGEWKHGQRSVSRPNRRSGVEELDIDDVLFLAARAGVTTRKELQQQIMTSPSFSPNRNPILLENMFSVASVPGMAVPTEDETRDCRPDTDSRHGNPEHAVAGGRIPKFVVSQARVAKLDKELSSSFAADPADLPSKTSGDEHGESPDFSRSSYGSASTKANSVSNTTTSTIRNQGNDPSQKLAAGIELLDSSKNETFIFNKARMLACSEGHGTNKRAAAHVVLRRGTGRIIFSEGPSYVNRFRHFYYRFDILKPFLVTNTCGAFDVYANVRGGGPGGQSSALRLAIARALSLANPSAAATLRTELLLYEDLRQRWPKMPMRYGARSDRKYRKR